MEAESRMEDLQLANIVFAILARSFPSLSSVYLKQRSLFIRVLVSLFFLD